MASDKYGKKIVCPKCKKEFLDTENKSLYICDECLENAKFLYRYNAKKCFDLSKEEKEQIEINAFLTSQFSVDEIETILLNELRRDAETPYSDYINFIEKDEYWFAESIAKGGESE